MSVTEARQTRWGDRQARDLDIRRSATELLVDKGFNGLTMRAVADGAGVSLGLVYRYYASKEELYASLYATRLEQFGDDIVSSVASAADAIGALEALFGLYLDVYRTFGKDADAFLFGAAKSSGGAVTAQRLAAAAGRVLGVAWSELARHEPRLLEVPIEQREAAIQLVWISMRGLAEHAASPRAAMSGVQPEDLASLAAKVLVSGLRSSLGDIA